MGALPAVVLLLAGAALIAAGGAPRRRAPVVWGAVGALAAAAGVARWAGGTSLGGALRVDAHAVRFAVLALAGTLVAVALAGYRERGVGRPRLPGILLVGAAGLWVLCAAARTEALLTGYLLAAGAGLAGLREAGGGQTAARYLTSALLGLASLVLGALALGHATGGGRLDLLAVPADYAPPAALAAVLPEGLGPARAVLVAGGLLVGLGGTHLLAGGPLCFWAPSGAQRAPAALAVWLLGAVPAAAAGALARVLLGFASLAPWRAAPAFVGLVTVGAGYALALRQEDLRRLAAWLAVAQGGHLLIGLAALEGPGAPAALAWQAAAGLLAVGGTFAVVLVAENRWGDAALFRFVGLGRRSPWLAGALVVALATHAGLPLTVGFPARVRSLLAGLSAEVGWAAAGGLLGQVLAAAVCLRVARLAFVAGAGREGRREPVVASSGATLLFGGLALLSLWLGLAPGGLEAL